jgi:hypothetical protein
LQTNHEKSVKGEVRGAKQPDDFLLPTSTFGLRFRRRAWSCGGR